MNLFESFCKLTQDLGKVVTKREPEILAGFAIGCFTFSTISAIKVTPKAVELIEQKKEEIGTEKLSAKDTVKTVWKLYLPAATAHLAGTALTCKSVSTNNKRLVALSTSYELVRDFAKSYTEKTKEIVGERKEEKIRDAINEQKIDNNTPVQNVNVIMPKSDGSYRSLFYEPITNTYFWETRAKVEIAMAKAYEEVRNSFDGEMSVYTWLSFLPSEILDNLPDGMADRYMNMGWEKDHPYEGFSVDIGNPIVVKKGEWEGIPCLPLEYGEIPEPSFRAGY